jgi:sulfide:quinone oxidoreductase
MSASKTILVLGGGVGGLVTTVELRKKVRDHHRIVLVDREDKHVFAPSLLWLMTGKRKRDRISRPLERLAKKGIEVIRGEIERILPTERSVTIGGNTLSADYLVIALGADLAPETIPGLVEAGHNFYSLAGAESLRAALASFTAGQLVVLTAAPAYKCPAAPYEAAMLLEADCRRRTVRDHVRIDLYAAEPAPMGVAGPDVSAAVREMIRKRASRITPSTR